jgi:adenosylcobinamide-phosphate synthase
MTLSSWLLSHSALPLGAALDFALGDPRQWPHPVRAIGGLIQRTEGLARALLAWRQGGPFATRLAGVGLAALVLGLTLVTTALLVWGLDRMGEPIGMIGRVLLIYWGLAARSLGREALRASEAGDLTTARRELAHIVGRDTNQLDWPEIRRACLETVGENANDGVVAPLFWFTLGGVIGLWAYKTISTLDSMVGYRDERYVDLGWASARLDDLASWLPARLTWLLLAVGALLVRERAVDALRIGWRDGREHPSPNSAWGEAALAGALRVRLGGPATYGGVLHIKPSLGEAIEPIEAATVRRGVRVLWAASAVAVVLAWATRVALQWTS